MSAKKLIEIESLTAKVTQDESEKEILNGVDLSIREGEVHVLMGTNGSGKSTLASVLMGSPFYEVTGGSATYEGKDLLSMKPEERAQSGLFLAFQYPTAVPGLSVLSYLRSIMKAVRKEELSFKQFKNELNEAMKSLNIPQEFLSRSLNEGFSGGEKKRLEVLQMTLLKPRLAMLDETDSGLDVDATQLIFEKIRSLRSENQALLVITHYNRIVEFISPDFVHVMKDGKIVASGGAEMAARIESEGFEAVLNG